MKFFWTRDSAKISSTPHRFAEATEDTGEVEQVRQVEQQIAATTGWNSSTMVLGQVLRRLRGDHAS